MRKKLRKFNKKYSFIWKSISIGGGALNPIPTQVITPGKVYSNWNLKTQDVYDNQFYQLQTNNIYYDEVEDTKKSPTFWDTLNQKFSKKNKHKKI